MTWKIRTARAADVPQIYGIERSSFPKPWDEEVFRIIGSWGGRIDVQREKTVFMYVIAEENEVLGYVVWQEDRYLAEGHILNIAVIQTRRQQGIGKYLLDHALHKMRTHKITTCRLEVRESNVAAKVLYTNAGMSLSSQETGYYDEEDALIYTIRL